MTGQPGNVDIQQKDLTDHGVYFINSGVTNQGIKGKTEKKATIFKEGTITIDFFGNVFYRPFKYKLATHNHVFSFDGPILKNKHVSLYVVAQLQYLRYEFSYSNMGTLPLISQKTIHLPINSKGEIDFDFMESRVRELEESRVRELEIYLKEAGLEDSILTAEEEEALHLLGTKQIAFKPLSIVEEVFDVKNAHNILKSEVVLGSGAVPYVTAGEGNNAVMGYISYKDELKEPGNLILIGGKTCVITYQPAPFFTNDSHNLLLSFKEYKKGEEATYLFCVGALKKNLQSIYSWGDSISGAKIKKDVVYLPVDKDGKIMFSFMRTCISAVKKKVISNLKDYFDKEHNAYLAETSK